MPFTEQNYTSWDCIATLLYSNNLYWYWRFIAALVCLCSDWEMVVRSDLMICNAGLFNESDCIGGTRRGGREVGRGLGAAPTLNMQQLVRGHNAHSGWGRNTEWRKNYRWIWNTNQLELLRWQAFYFLNPNLS